MKNQATIEFMIIFSLLLFAMAIAAVFATQRINEVHSSQTAFEAEHLLGTIGGLMDTVVIEGDGFSSTVVIPNLIAGRSYTLTAHPNLLVLRVGNQDFTRSVLADTFSGSFALGGEQTIKNAGGVIEIL